MFDDIIDKLKDHDFLEVAIEQREKNVEMLKEKSKRRQDRMMTDEQAKCYLERYPDLRLAFGTNLLKAKQHWNAHGFDEKRTKSCETDL